MALDLASLLIGITVATILWWVITRARRLLRQLRESARVQRDAAHERRMSDLEANHRRIMLRRAQGMHLAAPLFALDEILEEPLLLAPPPRIEPEAPAASEDAVTMTVPYLPTWPELAATYEAPSLSLDEALAGGVPLVLIGQPGIGKTVALAHLATLAANRRLVPGPLSEQVPFLMHVSELQLPVTERTALLSSVIDSSAAGISMLDLGRIEKFVNGCFEDGRALLLMDGFDELTESGQRLVTEFLQQIQTEYPRSRIVTTGAPESLDGLLGLGFVPLAVLPWNHRRQVRFMERWIALWSRTIARESASLTDAQVAEPALMGRWLDQDNRNATPLELTLKLWAGCAGDWGGPRKLDAIAAHIRRLVPDKTSPSAIETLAVQVTLTAQPHFDPRKARAWVREFELPEVEPTDSGQSLPETEADGADESHRGNDAGRSRKASPATPGLLGKLSSTGLLMTLPGNKMRFAHPILGGFLAGRGLSGYKARDTLINQPDWIGKSLTMQYFAAHADAKALAESMLGWSRLPMHRPTLAAARWLRDAPPEVAWRGRVLAALAELLRTPGLPLSLRGQAVAALAAANDPAVALLFRELLSRGTPDVTQLAALGAGALGDTKAIPALKDALVSPGISMRRAACLALVAIGSTEALEAIGEALLRGDDDLRRSAAEALANDPAEGHAMLKDGASMADIPLRRATAYGLGRIADQWADDLLDSMRAHDEQWIVRNAASEMIEMRSRTVNPRTPRPLPAPSESPWLIKFAGAQGAGISPGAPATPVLLAALKSSNGDERLAAIEYLKRIPTEGTVKELYAAMFGGDFELREASFLGLWELGASGFKLPDPARYGFN